MATGHHWKWRWAGCGGDDQAVADTRPQPARGSFGHSTRGLSDSQTHVVLACRPAAALQCTLDEQAGIDGTNAGADDGQQI